MSSALLNKIIEVNQTVPFTDVNLAPDMPVMIRTPGGYQAVDDIPVRTEDIEDLLALPGMAGKNWRNIMDARGGAFGFARTTTNSRLRLSVYESGGDNHTLRVAIRRLPKAPPTLNDIGLPEFLPRVIQHGRGLFLITGPTGAGKSTTLAAILNQINHNDALHIQTIEEPIEYELKAEKSVISQIEVPANVGSFQQGVYDALRHRPDIIAIGEMRDKKTVSAALQAASSGHFVLGTLHTSSADETVDSLLQFYSGQESEQKRMLLANTLSGVISQVLVPDKQADQLVLAYEYMRVNQSISNLIHNNKIQQLPAAIEDGRSSGMCTLNDSLNRLIEKDRISRKAAMRASYDPAGIIL